MSAVVVDTSVWVDFLAGRPTERLEEALRLGSVVVPPIVVSEILSGVRARDRAAVVELLNGLQIAESSFDHWVAVGDLRSMLQRRGLNVSAPDAHVAQCALDRRALLLSHDAVLTKIAGLTGLSVARG